MNRDELLDTLIAEREIRQLAHTLSRYVDRGNIEGMRSMFHPDAIAEYGFNKTKTVDEFLDHFKVQITTLSGVQHHITTSNIRVEGDYAEAENYAIAHCDLKATGMTVVIGGRYLDKLERRGGVWKIAHRIGLEDWSVKTPAPPPGANDLVGVIPRGALGEADPAYGFFRLIK